MAAAGPASYRIANAILFSYLTPRLRVDTSPAPGRFLPGQPRKAATLHPAKAPAIVPRMASGRLVGRAAEFVALYVGLPLVLAFALPADWLRPVFFAVAAVAVVLLARTPGFAWGELARGWTGLDWRFVGLVAAVTAALAAMLVWWLVPDRALALPRRSPALWLTILLLYPLLSALPQELIFRLLYFRRYAALFPSRAAAVAVNALVFALAHLVLWNWVALALTLAGGLIFARAYLARGGFAQAVVLHAVCGAIVFTSGLGSFFYHGAIAR